MSGRPAEPRRSWRTSSVVSRRLRSAMCDVEWGLLVGCGNGEAERGGSSARRSWVGVVKGSVEADRGGDELGIRIGCSGIEPPGGDISCLFVEIGPVVAPRWACEVVSYAE